MYMHTHLLKSGEDLRLAKGLKAEYLGLMLGI